MKSSRQKGNSLVEFTIAAPLLSLLFLGAWHFGYTFYIYAELEHAVRAGARYASVKKYDSSTSTPTPAFLNAVQNVVVYGDPAPANSAVPIASGLTKSNVAVTVTFASGAPTGVSVGITNYRVPGVFGNLF